MRKWFKFILIFIIFALVATGGIFIYKKFQDKKSNNGGNIEPTDIFVGKSDAPVTIVEYFSYVCGYCLKFHKETFPKMKENYIDKGKVKFIYRIVPPYEMAMAGLCAKEQNKFFEYHEYLFGHSTELKKVDDLKIMAKSAGLDENDFNQCLDSEKYLETAKAWYNEAEDAYNKGNIPEEQRGTPTFLINGKFLIGAQPYEEFEKMIENEL